jgi:hypothetical protein
MEGVRQIFLFLILLFSVTRKGSWMILCTTAPFAHTARPNKISSRSFTQIYVKYCTYICYFGLRTVFNHVSGHFHPPMKLFFLVLDNITSNKLTRIFLYFWGVEVSWHMVKNRAQPKITNIGTIFDVYLSKRSRRNFVRTRSVCERCCCT